MSLGKLALTVGLALVTIGLVLLVMERLGLTWGRLPLDLHWRGRNWSVSLPLATSLVISVIATIVINLLIRK